MKAPRLRHVVVGVLAAAVAGIAVVVGLGRVAGASRLRSTLEGADPRWLVLCAIGQILVFTGYAGVLRRATSGSGSSLSASASLRIVLASFAATQLFAFGGAAGLALVYWVLRRQGRDRRDAAVTLIGLNTAVYSVFAMLAFTAAALAVPAGSAPAGMIVPWLIGVPVIVALAGWFTAPEHRSRWTAPDGGRLRRLLSIGVDAAAWTRTRLSSDPSLFGWALLYWIGDIVSLAAALRSFGSHAGPASLSLAYATGYLAQAIPLPMIATAGVDAATTATLHAVGLPLETSLLGVVAHRLFAFWLPVIPGAVLALMLPSAAWADTTPDTAGEARTDATADRDATT